MYNARLSTYFAKINKDIIMKKGIHPENYRTVLFYDSNAKQGFLIRSCARTTATMKWEDGNE